MQSLAYRAAIPLGRGCRTVAVWTMRGFEPTFLWRSLADVAKAPKTSRRKALLWLEPCQGRRSVNTLRSVDLFLIANLP